MLCGALGKTRETFGNRICLDRRTVLNRPSCRWASHPDPRSVAGVSVVSRPSSGRSPPGAEGLDGRARGRGSLHGSPCSVPPEAVAFTTPHPVEVPAAWLTCRETRAAPLLKAPCGLSASTRALRPHSSASLPEGRPRGFPSGGENRHRVGLQSVAAQTLGKWGSFQLTTWAVGETHAHILFWP